MQLAILAALLASASAASLAPRAPVLVSRLRGAGSDVDGLKLAPKRASPATAPAGQPRMLVRGGAASAKLVAKASKIDVALLAYFFFWYLLNYYYTLNNKRALTAAGGKDGFPMTVAFLQLLIGSLYGAFLWAAPDARKVPTVTGSDLVKMMPIAVFFAGAHAFSVFSMGAGAVSFTQIVKAAEPAFAAVLGTTIYGKSISKAKWLALIPVIGGVCLASAKELDFAWSALITAMLANLMAAFRSNENKRLMDTAGLKERIGSVGNQFALTMILSSLVMLPVWMATEMGKWGAFVEAFKASKALQVNLITSGLFFYIYNELSTLTIKKTSATTQSVANTAKRVIVIVGVALVLGESLDPMKLLGCAIGIGGVFLYSVRAPCRAAPRARAGSGGRAARAAGPPATSPRGEFRCGPLHCSLSARARCANRSLNGAVPSPSPALLRPCHPPVCSLVPHSWSSKRDPPAQQPALCGAACAPSAYAEAGRVCAAASWSLFSTRRTSGEKALFQSRCVERARASAAPGGSVARLELRISRGGRQQRWSSLRTTPS